MGVIVILIVAIGGLGYLYYGTSVIGGKSHTLNVQTQITTQTVTSVTGNAATSSPDTLAITVDDPGISSPIGSAVVTIYPAAGTPIVGSPGQSYNGLTASESGTAGSSSGTYTTSKAYYGGSTLVVEVHKANYVTEFWQITAPTVTGCQGVCSTAAPLSLNMLNGPTMTIKLADQSGNFFTSNSTKPISGVVSKSTETDAQLAGYGVYNFTTMSTTSQTFTVYIYNTAVNTGWASTWDPINKIMQHMVLQIENSNGTASVSSLPTFICPAYTGVAPSSFTSEDGCLGSRTVGTAQYWGIVQNDGYVASSATAIAGGVTQFKVGSTIVAGSGEQSYSFTVSKGSLTAGKAQEFQLQLEQNASESYFVTNGNYGPNAATIGSAFTFWVAA